MRECFVCCRYANTERHHLIGGTAKRRISDRYGLVVDLCRECHHKAHADSNLYLMLHQYGERQWLKQNNATMDDFIKVFGKNYL